MITKTFDLSEGSTFQYYWDEEIDKAGIRSSVLFEWQSTFNDFVPPPEFDILAADRRSDSHQAFILRLGHHLICLSLSKPSHVEARIASPIGVSNVEVQYYLRQLFPLLESTDEQTKVDFWYSSAHGGGSEISRKLDTPSFATISSNYTRTVIETIKPLIVPGYRPGGGGKLILWRGHPGTGKTWMIRALMHEWRDWASCNYITDPDMFFGGSITYMMKVVMNEDYRDSDKWKLLIFEDTGELISADAKQRTGQGLSRLLNIVDGIIGQGLKVIVLITTNEDVTSLHPAVTRPGRCLQDLHFLPLTAHEADTWRKSNNLQPTGKIARIADLYAELGGRPVTQSTLVPIGFNK